MQILLRLFQKSKQCPNGLSADFTDTYLMKMLFDVNLSICLIPFVPHIYNSFSDESFNNEKGVRKRFETLMAAGGLVICECLTISPVQGQINTNIRI